MGKEIFEALLTPRRTWIIQEYRFLNNVEFRFTNGILHLRDSRRYRLKATINRLHNLGLVQPDYIWWDRKRA